MSSLYKKKKKKKSGAWQGKVTTKHWAAVGLGKTDSLEWENFAFCADLFTSRN